MSNDSSAPPERSEEPILVVDDLVIQFKVDGKFVTAVDGLSFHLHAGKSLGIVGESGSGKSVTNLAVMGLLPKGVSKVPRGRVMFEGRDLLRLKTREMRKITGNQIAMIFQDPMTSLNPFLKVSTQLVEVLRQHQKMSKKEAQARSMEMLRKVGIPDVANRFHQYPHQFSGGMCQRVMIAMMLLNEPQVLIADEPTTALDVTIQAQILDILRDMQSQLNTAIILITHDLGVVAEMADHIMVMYSGRTMESASTLNLFQNPSHPYTLGLLRSLPSSSQGHGGRLYSIPGRPPDLDKRPEGCPFAPRCDFVQDRCKKEFPPAVQVAEDHVTYCWSVDEVVAAREKRP